MTVKDIAEHFRSISRKKTLVKSKGKEFVKNTAEKRKSDEKAHLGSPAKKPNLKYTNIKEFWTSLGGQNYAKNGALSGNNWKSKKKTYVRRKVKEPWTENLCSSTIFSFDLVTTYPLYRDQVSKRDKKYIDNSDNFTI